MIINALSEAGLFLINVIFDLYLFMLMIRLILFWNGANYFNPITQVIIRFTQPVIERIRCAIPNYRKFESSTFVVILLVEMVKYFLVGLFMAGFTNNIFALALLSLTDFLRLLLNTFFYAILLQALLSWIHAGSTAVLELLTILTAPVMRPFKRLIPPIGGMDFSPIPAMIVLQLLIILVVNPLSILALSF